MNTPVLPTSEQSTPLAPSSSFVVHRPSSIVHRLLFFILGLLLILALAAVRGWPDVITGLDVNQQRLDQALPALSGTVEVQQSFRPQHDGLTEVELLLARYGESNGADTSLRVQLWDAQGQLVAEQVAATRDLAHNQTYVLDVPRQDGSAGRLYTLRVRADAETPFSVWGYGLDVYEGGALTLSGAESAAGELRFVTRYELTVAAAVAAALGSLWRGGATLVLALLWATMPGALLLVARCPRSLRWDGAAWWGVALALGLSAWPLVWHGLTLAGGRWAGWGLWLVLGLGWATTLALWLRQRAGLRPAPTKARQILRWEHAALGMILLGGLAVRLLAVRDLVFPPWVDSVRHTLITELMVRNGQVISDYAPLLPIARFPYHFGYHVWPASLLLMTGWPLPETLLVLGQLLNVLVALSAYAAGWLVTRRRGAGLVAAFLVAFPLLFPAYYATWGRFTQGTAMVVMPVVVALLWLVVRGGRGWRGAWWMVGLLAAGLFLIHLRVFIYFLPFPLLVWVGSRARRTRWLLAAGALGGALVAPRIWYLFPRSRPIGQVLTTTEEGYNAFPIGYLTAGWERYFIVLGGAALLLALVALLRRRPWAALPVTCGLWVGALFLSLGGRGIGLPESWLINLNSMYITLFFQLALVLGIVGERVWRGLARARAVRTLRYAVLGAGVTATLLFGVRHQITILNPQTILAERADREALAWMAANLPASARVGVSSWPWLGGTWSGSDGGAWLLPVTGLATTTPPADYSYSAELHQSVAAFNEAASKVEDWGDPVNASWLREQGVTHLYVGARGGFLDPAELARNPALTLLHQHEATFVFAVTP